MQGLKIISDPVDKGMMKLPTSALTASVGDVLELTAGSTTWAKVTATSNYFSRKAIVMEAATAASSILCVELTGNELVQAESVNASNVAHNGQRMVFTDENTVNNTGSDSTTQVAGFIQYGTVGATTENQIFGRVIVGPSVDPDAT